VSAGESADYLHFLKPHSTSIDIRSEQEIATLLARHEQDMASALEREERYSHGPTQTAKRPVTPRSNTRKAKPLRRCCVCKLAGIEVTLPYTEHLVLQDVVFTYRKRQLLLILRRYNGHMYSFHPLAKGRGRQWSF
jgi:hypothetical protein